MPRDIYLGELFRLEVVKICSFGALARLGRRMRFRLELQRRIISPSEFGVRLLMANIGRMLHVFLPCGKVSFGERYCVLAARFEFKVRTEAVKANCQSAKRKLEIVAVR